MSNTYRNIHDGAISYGDPRHYNFPDDWERVFVFTQDELYAGIMADREASARAIEDVASDPERVRPRVDVGEFLNDFAWAADIVRDRGRV